jgi:Cu/Ag efflux protein CusF|nr:MAG TPA: AAA domain protein [Caudoviricetes sp.]
MNQYNFTDAVRDDTSLLIAIAGASGSGKTYSALKMATGLAQGEPIYGIDTEAKRMLHYANDFNFKHLDMRPPFTPEAFMAAIQTAERAGAKVIIVDSMSDEYEGVGGLQEMHDDEVARLARKPFDNLEGWEIDKYNAPGWKVPKTRHKTRLISPLRQVRCYVIFCMRAEEKIKFVKVRDERTGKEKTAIEQAGWTPVAEKRFMYDMTMSFTVTPEHPGVPLIKDGQAVYGKLQQQHLAFFPEGKRVSEDAGRQLRAWARGETLAERSPPAKAKDAGSTPSHTGPASAQFSLLLTSYHDALAGEAFREGLEESHAEQRSKFADMPSEVVTAARNILNLHTDRVENRISADEANTNVQSIIRGIAA